MADLPNIGLRSYLWLFSNTGVDYFVPVQAKTSRKTRTNQGTLKSYGLIFTFVHAKAIHMEFSVDLSTDSFSLPLRRFITRRVLVNIMQSDNGTNFIGQVKEINDAKKILDTTK